MRCWGWVPPFGLGALRAIDLSLIEVRDLRLLRGAQYATLWG